MTHLCDQAYLRTSRFITLAKAGGNPKSSTGERVAHRLAVALHEIGDDIALLDYDALDGFTTLCHLAAGPWPTEARKTGVFDAIARATRPDTVVSKEVGE